MTDEEPPRWTPLQAAGKAAYETFVRLGVDAVFSRLDDALVGADSLAAVFKELQTENDRAFTIVAVAYIDSRLRDLWEAALNPELVGGPESLLGSLSPLGSLSARIQMAFALNWLRPATYKNAHALRKIRNEFAHTPFARDLSAPRVQGLFGSMEPTEVQLCTALSGHLPPPEAMTASHKLRARTILLAIHIVEEMTVAHTAVLRGLDPHAPLGAGWDRFPEPLKKLWNLGVDAIFAQMGLQAPAYVTTGQSP